MRAGARDTSVPSEFADAPSPGSREIQPLLGGSEPGRMRGVGPLWAGRAALCGMSAPVSAVTSRREARPERPLAEPLPAASAAQGGRIFIMSSTARRFGAAAQVRRLVLGVAGAGR
jgi:hypothetical protein